MDTALTTNLHEAIAQSTGRPSTIQRIREVGGGSISRSFAVETACEKWFVKINRRDRRDMFEAEVDGLRALAQCDDLRTPAVAGAGTVGTASFLVLEYVDLFPMREPDGRIAGRAIAALHRITGERFGWHRANYIGSTPQTNWPKTTWPDFFADERLRPQLAEAERRAYPTALIDKGQRLSERLHAFFTSYRPRPSLLHGDLWSGNAACDAQGRPVVFDPAVYYGDREADLAMTELFGGFPAGFHRAYRDAWPVAEGYEERRTLYNLYHVLNHLNLFGGGYLRQAERMIDALLAELG